MRSDRDYGLMPYLSYLLVPFFPLFQERGAARVERPKADWEVSWLCQSICRFALTVRVQNYVVTRTNEEIYKSLSRCLRAASGSCGGHFRHMASNQILQLEFAPLINRIISPPLRPVRDLVFLRTILRSSFNASHR